MFNLLFSRRSSHFRRLTAAAAIICLAGAGFIFGPALLRAGESPAEELCFTILHTNDEHSALIPHSPAVDFHPAQDDPTVGGYARLAAAVNQIREEKRREGEPVLLLSGGDYMGGSPFSWLIPEGFAPGLILKQLIGYDAVTIGNHEYDYGPEILASYLRTAGYPAAHDRTVVLATNTVTPPGHLLAEPDLYRKTHLLTLSNGLVVGIFGLIGKDAVAVAANTDSVEFKDQHETARAAVEELREKGAEVIVALTHAGVEEDRVLAAKAPGIHVIVGGHCHTALSAPLIENRTIIVQAGSMLEYLGRLELAYNRGTGETRLRNVENGRPYLLRLVDDYPLDPIVSDVIANFTRQLNSLVSRMTGGRFQHIMDTVAVSNFALSDQPPLQESPFGNFVTDAMRLVTWEKTGERVDFALQANGNIRGSVTPGTMLHARDRISFYDLAELVGLGAGPDGQAGYPLVSVYLTGEEMRRVLEVAALLRETMGDICFLQFSGLRYDFNPRNTVLLTVPVLGTPVPTAALPGRFGAVLRAERYNGEGVQSTGDEGYVPLKRGDENLYHLVADSYTLSFLPVVGKLLPTLDLVLKDKNGNPVPLERLDDHIVRVDGKELKVWQAVVEYAASQPLNETGIPEVDPCYAETAGRINPVRSIPLITWPILLLVLLLVVIVLLVRRRRLQKPPACKSF